MFEEPNDGWLPEEKAFFRLTVIMVYRKISDPIDKFIFIAMHESGYTQQEIGTILKISQEAVSKRYNNILRRLRDHRKRGIL